ncbi:hypothetical protein EDB83DRAFT_2364708 [Lactarius deliciosus]|nr:hypothetical protein EDB83DRAFT_2364708 [Lactarius deliciosus]
MRFLSLIRVSIVFSRALAPRSPLHVSFIPRSGHRNLLDLVHSVIARRRFKFLSSIRLSSPFRAFAYHSPLVRELRFRSWTL